MQRYLALNPKCQPHSGAANCLYRPESGKVRAGTECHSAVDRDAAAKEEEQTARTVTTSLWSELNKMTGSDFQLLSLFVWASRLGSGCRGCEGRSHVSHWLCVVLQPSSPDRSGRCRLLWHQPPCHRCAHATLLWRSSDMTEWLW